MNEQINHEFYSAYLYLSMAAYFHELGLKGFARWLEIQAKEEVEHAIKFYKHLVDKGEKVVLKSIKEPPKDWESPKEAFSQALEHEKKITRLIYDIGKVALKEEEYGTWEFLNWFYKEQIEEEDIVRDVLNSLNLIGEDKVGLYLLDKELGGREEG